MFKVHFSSAPNLSGLTGPMGTAYRWAAKDALAQTGGHVRGLVRKHVETGGSGWKGLSAMTKAMRDTVLSPLFNLGKLVRFKTSSSGDKLRVQIGFFPTRKLGKKERASFFDGLKTGQKYKIVGGKKAAQERARFRVSMGLTQEQLARKHEFGQSVRVTKAMRRAMAAMGHPLRKTTTVLPVPSRPMVSTVYRTQAAAIDKYYQQHFAAKLKAKLLQALGKAK